MKNGRKWIFFVVGFALIFNGCYSEEEGKERQELQRVTLTDELTISANTGEALIGEFAGLSVDSEGMIYAVDTQQQKIHAFGPDGTYADSIGRRGEGPGEFSNMDSNINLRSDTLYALQSRLRRIELFNRKTGDYIRSISIPETEIDGVSLGVPKAVFPQADGSFLIYLMSPHYFAPEQDAAPKYATVARMGAAGNVTDKNIYQTPSLYPSEKRVMYREDGNVHVYRLYIYPEYVMAAGPDGSFYHAKTDSLKITQYDRQGRKQQELQADYSRIPFTSNDLDSMVSNYGGQLQRAIESVGKPDYLPSFNKLLVDDGGRVWVQLFTPGEESRQWRIFDDEGNLAWKLQLPDDVELYDISRGKAYGIERKDEALPVIHRYDVEL